ncbi:MAG: hypothetical protein NYU40_04485 [Aigarchaeota archaeon]|nr:hypothetical protein [Candidatus Caldarchaeales archaeon]
MPENMGFRKAGKTSNPSSTTLKTSVPLSESEQTSNMNESLQNP